MTACPECGSEKLKIDPQPIVCREPGHLLCFRYLRCENCGNVIMGSIHNFVVDKELRSAIDIRIPEGVERQ